MLDLEEREKALVLREWMLEEDKKKRSNAHITQVLEELTNKEIDIVESD